jgi:hypothetical protein
MWLGLSGIWSMVLFGWMAGWTQFGEQNQVGETLEVPPERYQGKVSAFRDAATETERGLVPPDTDVYVGAMRYAFDGLPAVIEAGTEYTFHLGTYDVQHGFSVRQEDTLSKQLSPQMLPGYEWLMLMQFGETGTYHVVCNEFCGTGHRTMHATFEVVEDLSAVESGTDGGSSGSDAGGDGSDSGNGASDDYGGWFTDDASGGALFVVAAVGTLLGGGTYEGDLPVEAPTAFGTETAVPDGGDGTTPDGGEHGTTPDGGVDATASAGGETAEIETTDPGESSPSWYEDAAHHALSMRGTFVMTLVFPGTFVVLWALNWYLLSQLWHVG